MKNYRLSQKAEFDLQKIYIYSAENFGETKTKALKKRMNDTLDKIVNKESGYSLEDDLYPNLRSMKCHPFLIFYIKDDDVTKIIGIVHAQQDIPNFLKPRLNSSFIYNI